ncbi:MAG TPA: hypothetical protein VMQ17_17460 [Candidatus Sulfotelmatobacter sp.]|nr:hypothetical protein [Candidatus Sulfotelmatobacter sp.]
MCAKLLRKLLISVSLSIATCALALQGQLAASPSAAKPVAYVYISSTPVSGSPNVINGFEASSTGQLTPVTGSPFQANDGVLSVNGNKLYGINSSATFLDGYSIAVDGGLTYLTSTDYALYNANGCGFAGWVFSDRTGTDLYALNFDGDCANNAYQSFRVNPSSELTYLGSGSGGAGSFSGVYLPLTFLGNNKYGYEATNNGCFYYQVWGFQRTNNGDLVDGGTGATLPSPPPGYRGYIADFTASDSTNHVAIAMEPANPPGCSGASVQVGSFTADSNGNLSTTNTNSDMPPIAISYIDDMKISPSGKLLAVGGTGGLQILHFNGPNPPTNYSGLLTTDAITQMFWDDDQHLYAISPSAGRLHVYTITTTKYQEAPGSPYPITQPFAIAIQPRQRAEAAHNASCASTGGTGACDLDRWAEGHFHEEDAFQLLRR